MKFKKGNKVQAINNRTKEVLTFLVPHDNMCQHLLKRYVYMQMNKGDVHDKWTFIKLS